MSLDGSLVKAAKAGPHLQTKPFMVTIEPVLQALKVFHSWLGIQETKVRASRPSLSRRAESPKGSKPEKKP